MNINIRRGTSGERNKSCHCVILQFLEGKHHRQTSWQEKKHSPSLSLESTCFQRCQILTGTTTSSFRGREIWHIHKSTKGLNERKWMTQQCELMLVMVVVLRFKNEGWKNSFLLIPNEKRSMKWNDEREKWQASLLSSNVKTFGRDEPNVYMRDSLSFSHINMERERGGWWVR